MRPSSKIRRTGAEMNKGSHAVQDDRLTGRGSIQQRGRHQDKKALPHLYYNKGNALFREGQVMMQSGQPSRPAIN